MGGSAYDDFAQRGEYKLENCERGEVEGEHCSYGLVQRVWFVLCRAERLDVVVKAFKGWLENRMRGR